MEIQMMLEEKTFKDDNGKEVKYHVLTTVLVDGSTLDINVKSDKVRLLLMSENLKKIK